MLKLSVSLIKELYYQKEMSAFEIGKIINRNESTVYKFMKRNGLPRRKFREANEVKFNKKPLTFLIRENLSLKEEKLKIAGIMLYWAEGAKIGLTTTGSKLVDFANSDPKMIKLFLKFLREICEVDAKRLRIYLYCYSNQDIRKLKQYWHKITKIPLAQFTKPYVRQDFDLNKSGKMKYGLVHVRYSDKKLLLQIEKWIDQYLKEYNILG